MFSPPRMITSLRRPTMRTQPSASTVARSPVRNQPPRAMTVAVCSRVGVTGEHLGTAHPELPGVPVRQRAPVSGSETRSSTAPTARPSVSRAFSNGSSSVLVVTVGASVEP